MKIIIYADRGHGIHYRYCRCTYNQEANPNENEFVVAEFSFTSPQGVKTIIDAMMTRRKFLPRTNLIKILDELITKEEVFIRTRTPELVLSDIYYSAIELNFPHFGPVVPFELVIHRYDDSEYADNKIPHSVFVSVRCD